jgi:hypothetical protein
MRYKEITEAPHFYYHGSYDELPVGTVLTAGADYEGTWGDSGFYQMLEQHRPSSSLAHKDAVFMAETPEDVDYLGGATDWLFTVKPAARVERHDQNWVTQMQCLLSEDHPADSPEVLQVIQNYWDGTASNSPVWEYLTPSAVIMAVEEY